MRGVLLRWLVLAAAVLIAAWLLDGIRVAGVLPALLAAALLGILNAVLRPLLIVLTLPLNILTLGLFTFVINALLLMLVSHLIPGFDVRGFWTAVFGALIIGLVSWLLNRFIGSGGRVLASASGPSPAFRLPKGERYVRAKVTDGLGQVALTQPLIYRENP